MGTDRVILSSLNEHEAQLRAILFIDACGYSSSVRVSELESLNVVRSDMDVVTSFVGQFDGEVINLTGDGLYASFGSARSAVDASLQIQRALKKRDRALVRGYRIGVHVGDTFKVGEQVSGDVVNIAARIEAVGESGTVLISKNVRDIMLGRPDLMFESAGSPALKNISQPVELFKVIKLSDSDQVCKDSNRVIPSRILSPKPVQIEEIGLVTAKPNFVVGILAPVPDGHQEKSIFVSNVIAELLSKSLSETEALEVHDFRLPAEKGLLKLNQNEKSAPDLFLQCRTSAYDNMLQVSVTALRPEDRKVIWSQNVMADQNDFLGLSTTGVNSFVSYATDALLTALVNGRHMQDPSAHHAAKKAIMAVHHLLTMTGPGLEQLEKDIQAAYETDPKPVYLAWLAYVTTFQVGERYGTWDAGLEERARDLVRRALEAGGDNGTILGLVTHVYSYVFREFEIAEDLINTALELSPYRAMCWDSAAMLYSYTGRTEKAVEAAERARQIGRNSPYRHLFDGACCVAAMVNGEFEKAAHFGESVMSVQPEFKTVMRYLAATYGYLGDRERGAKALQRLYDLEPDISLKCIRDAHFPVPTRFSAKLLETGLTEIGLPQHA